MKNLAEVNETISLYAQWSYNDVPPAPIGDSTYRIIFNANGGDGSMAVQDIVPNSSFELPANTFTNGDKKFIGWNLSADGTGVALPDRRVITSAASGEVTLYAQWEDPNLSTPMYTVVFDPNGGTGFMEDLTAHVGVRVGLPFGNFQNDGYAFAGWNTQPDGSGVAFDDGQTIYTNDEKTLTFYAQWRPL